MGEKIIMVLYDLRYVGGGGGGGKMGLVDCRNLPECDAASPPTSAADARRNNKQTENVLAIFKL